MLHQPRLSPDNPKPVLLLALAGWAASHGLSRNLAEAGFEVCAIFPPDHVLGSTRFVHCARRLTLIQRLMALILAAENMLGRSALLTRIGDTATRLLAALLIGRIRAWRPEMIIPVDERALRLCRDLAEGRAGQLPEGVKELLARSLGDLSTLSQRMTRHGNYRAAVDTGVRVPAQISLADNADWRTAAAGLGYPLVVKRENSSGGEGVTICHDETEAVRAIELNPRAASRWARIKQWWTAGRARQSSVSSITLQQYIPGTATMREVLCWNGEVIAGFSLAKTICYPNPSGPASVVQLIDNQEMACATVKIVRTLGLSGFADVDFMVDPATGQAYCIELNPRPTALTHLGARLGCDLGQALQCILSGVDLAPDAGPGHSKLVAIYPKEWWRDQSSAVLHTADHDVPWDDPGVLDYYARRYKAEQLSIAGK